MENYYKTVLIHFLINFFCFNSEPVQLGKHSKEEKGINLIGKFSTSGVFYEHFVKPGVPLLMKSVLTEAVVKFPAYRNWNDEYLRDNFGSEMFNVEKQKKENRKKKAEKMALGDFLHDYKRQSMYLIDSVSKRMKDDLALPNTLQCGGFEKSIHDVVLWFSSGGTRSVLHRDPLNNLLCLLDGSKDFYFINKKYKSEVESVGFVEDGTYSTVDVDDVDATKFKKLLSLPWVRTHADEGDCIFIPYGWYHQIRSNGRRNLAVNYWFTHRWWFDHPDCRLFETFNFTEPLNKYNMASSNELVRFQMLQAYRDLEVVTKKNFLEPDVDKVRRLELFNLINLDRDSNLTWEELYNFDIDQVVNKFPDVLAVDFVRQVEEIEDPAPGDKPMEEPSDNPMEEPIKIKIKKDEL